MEIGPSERVTPDVRNQNMADWKADTLGPRSLDKPRFSAMAPVLLTKGLMILLLLTVGLTAGGLAVGLLVASKAPLGYQDEGGFHYGLQSNRKATDTQATVARRPATQARLRPKPPSVGLPPHQ